MATRKKNPERSRITRVSTIAYARKQKPDGGEVSEDTAADGDVAPAPAVDAEKPRAAEAAKPKAAKTKAVNVEDPKSEVAKGEETKAASAEAEAASAETASAEAASAEAASAETASAEAEPAAPVAAKPAAPPAPAPAPVSTATADAEAASARKPTLAMPATAPIGRPPDMPAAAPTSSPRIVVADATESPTLLPGPREIPAGSPSDPAAPPGRVPPGDSRSMRRRDATTYEFSLIYRQGTFVISRFGVVGTRGQWRVVEYPTSAAASHAYAKECSRFVSEGFSDYRD